MIEMFSSAACKQRQVHEHGALGGSEEEIPMAIFLNPSHRGASIPSIYQTVSVRDYICLFLHKWAQKGKK